jgi:hypothetical protein
MSKDPETTTPRRIAARGWRSLTLAGAAMGLAAGAPLPAAKALHPVAAPETLWLAQGGEGGEGGEAGAVAGQSADVQYLGRLALVDGHLRGAVLLYQAGRVDAAAGLVGHPEAEMMEELRAQMAERGAEDFSPALEALVAAVGDGAPAGQVDAAYAAVHDGIRAAAQAGGGGARARYDALTLLMRAAADEYAEAVEDGDLADSEPYVEALGFAEVARGLAEGLAAASDPAVARAGAKALEAIAAAAPAFDGSTPAPGFAADPTILRAAAARVELAGSAIR